MAAPAIGDPKRARLAVIYEQYRDSRFNQLYYGKRLEYYRRISIACEIALILGTSGTIGAWAIFRTSIGSYIWGFIAGLATLIAVLQPVLRLKDRIERYSALYTGHSTVFYDLKKLVSEMKAEQTLTPEMWSRHTSAVERFMSLVRSDDPTVSDSLREECYVRVNEEIPPTSFWMPE